MFLIEHPSIAMRRRKVEVREHFDDKITIKFNGRYLQYSEIVEQKTVAKEKAKRPAVEPTKKRAKYTPPPDHPWRRWTPSLHHNSYLKRI